MSCRANCCAFNLPVPIGASGLVLGVGGKGSDERQGGGDGGRTEEGEGWLREGNARSENNREREEVRGSEAVGGPTLDRGGDNRVKGKGEVTPSGTPLPTKGDETPPPASEDGLSEPLEALAECQLRPPRINKKFFLKCSSFLHR